MRDSFLPFCRPDISEAEIESVAEVLRSGWITTGPKTGRFEERFRNRLGCPEAIAVSSATGGMHILLEALGIGPGDEVITPAMTWVSTPNLIVLAGATPVFVDVDRDHLMVDAERVAEKITSKTRLILPVHFAGAALHLEPIRGLAAQHGIPMVEDSAHAIGTQYQGEPIGRTGTSIFSFQAIKNLTTAEGGMLTTDDPALAERLRQLKFHGLGVDSHDRETQGRAPQAEVVEPGFKYNMTDISAAIGLGQLERLDEMNLRRRQLAEHYLIRMTEIEELLPLSHPSWDMFHSWHLFVVRVDDRKTSLSRDDFMAELKTRNIGTGIHFRAAHLQKFYRERFGYEAGMLPDTEWTSDRMCSLPLFSSMTVDDVDDVIEAIKEVFAG